MGENDNKYGQYFYGSVPAQREANTAKNMSDWSLISEGRRGEEPKSTSVPSFEAMDFISRGHIYQERSTSKDHPSLVQYPDGFSQSSEALSRQQTSYKPVVHQERKPITEKQMVKNVSNSVGKKESVKVSTIQEKDAIAVFGSMPKPIQKAVAGICVAVVFFLGAYATKTVRDFKDGLKVDEYVEQYEDAYSKNVRGLPGLDSYGEQNKDFNIIGMGKKIAASEDPEASLYAVYCGAQYERYTRTHLAFSYAKEINPDVFGESKTFEEYATSLGCIDKDGNIDYDRYEEITEARLLAKQILEENSVSEVSLKQ